MKFSIITLFPEYFKLVSSFGVVGRAITTKKELLKLKLINPRDFVDSNHKGVDDTSFGGGGMVLRADIMAKAIDAAVKPHEEKPQSNKIRVIHFSPSGEKLNQNKVKSLLQYDELILVCSRYEALDQRIIESRIDETISIGDFVISGAEPAALVLLDALIRLITGVINQKSTTEESFELFAKNDRLGLLEYPHYTKPKEFEGMRVPEVLSSGNHQAIEKWRHQQALLKTWFFRPELIKQHFTKEEFEAEFEKPLNDLLEKMLNKINN